MAETFYSQSLSVLSDWSRGLNLEVSLFMADCCIETIDDSPAFFAVGPDQNVENFADFQLD